MARNILPLAIALLACFSSVHSITIECIYSDTNWAGVEDIYTCFGTLSNIDEGDNVWNIVGTHESGRTDYDVAGLSVYNQRGLTRLPRSIEQFFPYLAALDWVFGDLTSLSSNDLESFPNLRILTLFGNQLAALDGGLFENTPNLEYVDLGNNLVQNVASDLFDNLTELRWVFFQSNPCVDIIAATPDAIRELSSLLVDQCPASAGVTIECEFVDLNWSGLENIYTCVGTISGNGSVSNIMNVVGTHIEGRSNDDVRGLSVYNQRGLTQLPRNIDFFFALQALDWVFGDLNFVSASNFIQQPELSILSLYGNRLTSLDGDLLQNNRRLQQIDLGNNLIQSVGDGLFDHLAELRIVLFQRNPCIDSLAGTPEAIEELILLLADQCPATVDVTVQCVYSEEIWAGIDTFYTCTGTIIGSGGASNIVDVVGTHIEGRSNADVTGFSIINQRGLAQLPGNTNNFFPNIRALDWIFGDLSTVVASNLLQFSNVEILSLYGNRLTSLEGNLFQNTRSLQQIDLGNNLIQRVGGGLFSNLTDLRAVLIQRNPCVDTTAATPEAIQELTQVLLRQCSAVAGLTIQCEFAVVNWAGIEDLYTCLGTIIGSGGANNIVNIVGTHPNGLNDGDVLGLSIYNQRGLTQLPGNINSHFPALTAFDWVFGDLTTVQGNNLAQLSNITMLNLYGNRLTSLNGNVFQNNRNLAVIDVGNNQINAVGPGLLNNLPQLRTVFFQRNVCIDFIASTPQGLEELNRLLRDQCSAGPPGDCPPECLARIDNLESQIVVLESALRKLMDLS